MSNAFARRRDARPHRPTTNRIRAAGRAALGLVAAAVLAFGSMAPAAAATTGTYFAGAYVTWFGARDYHGYVPSSAQPGQELPLVVALHGCTENDVGFQLLSGWQQKAEDEGFIVVFPDQNNYANAVGCWNWMLPTSQHRGFGEPALIAGITQRVASTYDVDRSRVYVTGVSAGGAMADIMATAYPDVYAAAGIIAGCEYLCDVTMTRTPTESGQAALKEMGSRARPVPVMIFQGTADLVVNPATASRIAGQWATVAGVDQVPDVVVNAQVPGGRFYQHLTYNGSSGAPLVEQYMIEGAGHVYPGGCACSLYGDTPGPDATTLMWDFFSQHPMP